MDNHTDKLDFYQKKWWILIAMMVAFAMVITDYTAIPVTLPRMQADLHASSTTMPWVMNIYLLPLAVLVIFGGKVGDMYGYRYIILIGLIVFICSSLLVAIAPNIFFLNISRCIQGIGGAFISPATAVIINRSFNLHEKSTAMGIFVGTSVIFAALGPVYGGFLTEYFSWRYVFALNIPLGIISMIICFKFVPSDLYNPTISTKLDWPGLLLLIIIFSAFVFSLMEGTDLGWSSYPIISGFIISIILFPLFIFIESKQTSPLIDLSLFKSNILNVTLLTLFIAQIGFIAPIFWALYLQIALKLTPFQAGIGLLPTILPFIFMPALGGYLMDRLGPKLPFMLSTGGTAIALFLVAIAASSPHYLNLLPGFLLFGLCASLIHAPAMTTALNNVPQNKHGITSGLCSAIKNIGSTFGIAVMSAILATAKKLSLTYAFSFSIAMFLMAVLCLLSCCIIYYFLNPKYRLF